MIDGFLRVAVGTPSIRVGDCAGNAECVADMMRRARAGGAKLLALPEMCLTGYTCGDLFMQTALQQGALAALETVARVSADMDMLTVVGLPVAVDGRLFNCAAVVKDGRVLGVVPKRNPPNYGEFYELRHFTPGAAETRRISIAGFSDVPFGGDILFECADMPCFCMGVEVCEDLWVPAPPSVGHALAGATVIVNPSASDEVIGKSEYRAMLLKSQSARLMCGYLYADAGEGESSTDMVFAGHNFVCENGQVLAEAPLYQNGLSFAELDLEYLCAERLRVNTFGARTDTHTRVSFPMRVEEIALTRAVDPAPFVPQNDAARARRAEEILTIQARGLATRLKHIGCQKLVVGVSGGLDSTLATIIGARALDILSLPADGLIAVTMPCFGTSRRTYENAVKLAKGLGARLEEINIREAVTRHFMDIGHKMDDHDVTYENSQARERTQVLMDYANQENAIVVGTGDLSELALGWATYNGDHMSMYGVNASVPKTLIRHLVAYAADKAGEGILREALLDVLDTPVSPELLPPVAGEISQKTEDIVGPYALHDFFLYHMLRRMEPPRKILRLACRAFEGTYEKEYIAGWLRVFLRRFFRQQFKRSCLPDGPKVGSVSLSPRGDWRMPSDASDALWRL